MSLRLKRTEGLQDGLERIAEQRLKHILQCFGQDGPTPTAIHEARKNIKGLRAMLRLVRGAISVQTRRRRNGMLRGFAAKLSARRDAVAILDTFAKTCRARWPTGDRAEPEPNWLRDARQALERKARAVAPPREILTTAKKIGPLSGRFLAFKNQLGSADGSAVQIDGWKETVEAGLQKTYRQGRRLLQAAEGAVNQPAEHWHELRKRAKDLGYQLAILEKLKRVEDVVADLDEIGTALGAARDLTLLQDYLSKRRGMREMSPADQRVCDHLFTHIDGRRNELHRQALRAARRVYRDGSRRFASRMMKRWRSWRSQG